MYGEQVGGSSSIFAIINLSQKLSQYLAFYWSPHFCHIGKFHIDPFTAYVRGIESKIKV